MITEKYVDFETAKLLKEKGFDEYTLGYYDDTGEFDHDLDPLPNGLLCPTFCSAPTIQMAAEWLRVEKGFYVDAALDIDYDEDENGIKYYHDPLYFGNIIRTSDGEQMYDGGEMYDQPEYAVEAMIRYCLENFI